MSKIIRFSINADNIQSLDISDTLPKIAAFDFDHTIVRPKDSRTFPKNKDDWMWVRPSIPEIIKQFYNNGYKIYIVTNQTKLWKLDMIKESLAELCIPIKVIVGFGSVKKDPNTIRKPDHSLFYDEGAIQFDKEHSFFCGDAAGRSSDFSDSDLQFAKNIEMTFKLPEDIFPIELIKTEDTRVHTRTHQELVILVGYPASGKSTWAKNNLEPHGYVIISGDELKTLPKMIKAAVFHLSQKKSVIFDRTNPKKLDREKIIGLAKSYNIPARCVVMTTTIEDSMEWNIKRLNETGKKIPVIAFYTFRKYYEPPTSDECEIVEI